jgi:hypothetical protein
MFGLPEPEWLAARPSSQTTYPNPFAGSTELEIRVSANGSAVTRKMVVAR